jgi:opacity protein-like surface antigen
MRTVTFALLTGFTLGIVAPVQAADLDYGVLRGPDYEPEAPLIDWNGVYVGGHGGYTSAALNFNNVFQPVVANALRQTYFESTMNASGLLTTNSTRVDGTSFGGYVGWNYQFDETVIGIEADYTRFGKTGSSANDIARFTIGTDGWLHAVSLDGTASTRIEDYGTIRARGGYAIGNFLPFVTGGLAIGRAQVADQVAIQTYEYDQAPYRANAALTDPSKAVAVGHSGYANFNPTAPDPGSTPSTGTRSTLAAPVTYGSSKTKVVGGITLGAGLEFALTQNIILRGEYQYVLFNDFDGHKVNLNTVRGGAALKF